jgi:hypothetical protein
MGARVGGIFNLLSGSSHGQGLAVPAVPLAAVIPSGVPGQGLGRMGGSAADTPGGRGRDVLASSSGHTLSPKPGQVSQG